MKLSDYVSQFLVGNGIRDLFSLSGGGIMHLLDSASKQPGLNMIYNLNEQATGICAETYGQYTNHLGACLVTTGPGATNSVTGCAGAWLDSTPVLYISGQTKTADLGQIKGLRQYGAQEIAIIPMVKSITKYSVIILDPNEIKYHLDKALYLATKGRRGPVWIDIPLDIQAKEIDTNKLKIFNPIEEGFEENNSLNIHDIKKVYELLNDSKQPVVLFGHGVTASGNGELLRDLLKSFNVPALATWRAKGIYSDDDPLFLGSPGIPATRYSNYVLQKSDFLLIIGTRLNPAITAYDETNFAPNAKKIIIDIDENEINKSSIRFELKIIMDAKNFIESFIEYKTLYKKTSRQSWLDYCVNIKNKYPIYLEKQVQEDNTKVDGYKFAEILSNHLTSNDIIVGSSSGRTCGISHMAIKLKENQKFISSMGLGSMGWCLPSAIACSIAGNKNRTILLEGDGSLQSNLQELALINTYKIPLKLFVLSNFGYASIYKMQENNFNSNFAGCDQSSGLDYPQLSDIAKLYNLDFYRINNNNEIQDAIINIMKDDKPVICEIVTSIDFDEIPKSKTIVNKDGTFSSSKLEFLYPFLDLDEHLNNMDIKKTNSK